VTNYLKQAHIWPCSDSPNVVRNNFRDELFKTSTHNSFCIYIYELDDSGM